MMVNFESQLFKNHAKNYFFKMCYLNWQLIITFLINQNSMQYSTLTTVNITNIEINFRLYSMRILYPILFEVSIDVQKVILVIYLFMMNFRDFKDFITIEIAISFILNFEIILLLQIQMHCLIWQKMIIKVLWCEKGSAFILFIKNYYQSLKFIY